jgi:hypothetical protein
MPTPRKGETQAQFIDRCVPFVLEDGSAKNQKAALGRCYGIWRNAKKEIEMGNSRKKRKQQALEAKKVAEDPLEDQELEEITDEEAQAILEVMSDDGKSKDEKLYEVIVEQVDLPFGGAKSWNELEEYLEAEATSDGIRQTEFEFRKMVANVLNDDIEVEEKGTLIASLAEGFAARAERNAEARKGAEEEPDLLVKLMQKLGLEDQAKARMTRAAINDLPDSAFAYVEPGGKKDDQGKTVPRSLRHYPVHDAAHVRNGLARAAQAIKKGGKTADIARKALPKIRAAAKKMGIGKSSGFLIEKDLQGNHRWFGWVSNQFRDRDKKAHPKGEIISEEAHKEFVKWVWADAKNRMPQLWLWHTPRTALKERWDWIDYADGFLLGSGPLTKEEAEMMNKICKDYDLGMSHGFFKIGYDSKEGIIKKYRTFEGSPLPHEFVANEWTDFETLQEGKDMGFTPDKRNFLVDALGEEKVAELESSTKDLSETLKELGIDFKEVEEAKSDSETKSKSEKPDEEKGVAPELKSLVEALGLDQLSEYLEAQDKAIAELKQTVVELKKSDDEKVAEAMKPKVDVEKDIQPIWMRRLSQSKETELSEEEQKKVEKAKEEGISWVSEAMGQQPVDTGAQVPV